MSDRLEWAHVDNRTELLYPGTWVDEATVDPGEMALAVWTGSNGIALYGRQQELVDRLKQLIDAVRDAPPVPERAACIDRFLDLSSLSPAVTGRVAFLHERETKCGTTGTVAADPHLATCPDCIEIYNDDPITTDESCIRLIYPVPPAEPSVTVVAGTVLRTDPASIAPTES
jgi:hypothetical protein